MIFRPVQGLTAFLISLSVFCHLEEVPLIYLNQRFEAGYPKGAPGVPGFRCRRGGQRCQVKSGLDIIQVPDDAVCGPVIKSAQDS